MADFLWHDFLEIGVKFIDDDHKKLLKLMQEIKQAIEQNNYDKCVVLLASLLKESREHFAREEAFLEEVNYPGLEKHKDYHRKLLIQAETVKQICEGIETEHDLKECFDSMEQFLIDDILKGDVMFVSYLEFEGHLDASNQ
jgi:hemerythrin